MNSLEELDRRLRLIERRVARLEDIKYAGGNYPLSTIKERLESLEIIVSGIEDKTRLEEETTEYVDLVERSERILEMLKK